VGRVEPTSDDFTGFVFKLQANMDPKHRDKAGRLLRNDTSTRPTLNLLVLLRVSICKRGLLRSSIRPTLYLLVLHRASV